MVEAEVEYMICTIVLVLLLSGLITTVLLMFNAADKAQEKRDRIIHKNNIIPFKPRK